MKNELESVRRPRLGSCLLLRNETRLEVSIQPHSTSRIFTCAFLALLLLSATSIGAQSPQGRVTMNPILPGRISGNVRDETGKPVSDVKIVITTMANSRFKKELTTGKDGSWATFLDDAPTPYHYRFEKPGYVAVEKDKKVPRWNPNDGTDDIGRRADLSVLDIQLFAQVPPAKDGA
jgi:hypothetical protein